MTVITNTCCHVVSTCAELHYTLNIEVSEWYMVIVMTEILGMFVVSNLPLADEFICRLSLLMARVLLAHCGCLNLLLSQHAETSIWLYRPLPVHLKTSVWYRSIKG